ncbi:hypothetical protein PYCCODRAFT_1439730 [Trametes coccinea BRFM310]|uniref:F-box domain-containing protein n=1 Tax=Trametes coccinea (strain BRFM310) TaxID=1353009 RepID=A0A1Y2IBW3_TRAC3|nr:hypothetical protein PYCCODRAFT_1439730 [Trametes coccinea BRFM310]
MSDDVLREVVGFLSDSDHLRLALTAKLIYTAIPPRPTVVALAKSSTVLSLHSALSGSSHTSPGLLRALGIHLPTSTDVKAARPLLRDIFVQARNLRSLTLGAAEYADIELRHSIQAFSSLTHLVVHEGRCCSPTTPATTLPRSIRSLHLRSSANGTPWRLLVRSLSGLPLLETLKLEQCMLEDDDEDDEDVDDGDDASDDNHGDEDENNNSEDSKDSNHQKAPQSLLHVRTLHALSTPLPTSFAAFANLFPKVDTMVLEDSDLPIEDEDNVDYKSHSLRHVTLSAMATPSSSIPWNVDNLTLSTTTLDHNIFMDEIYVCFPEGLSGLSLRLPELTGEMWTVVVDNTSRLRRLELETYAEGIVYLLAMLADIFDQAADDDYDSTIPQISMLSIAALGRHEPQQFDEVLTRFLGCLPTGLPTLRYVAIAAPPKISMNISDDLAGERAPWRWWRIIRTDGEAETREIPAWEGERVRQFFRGADEVQANTFEEQFQALR